MCQKTDDVKHPCTICGQEIPEDRLDLPGIENNSTCSDECRSEQLHKSGSYEEEGDVLY